MKFMDLTDPAKDLYELGNELKAVKQIRENSSSYYALAGYVGLKADSSELVEVISIVSGRLNKLSNRAKRTTDPHLFEEQKKNIVDAAECFGQLFHPKNLVINWDEAKKKFLGDAQLNSLLWFSPIIRKTIPLKRLTDEERALALSTIVETIREIEGDIGTWTKEPLLDGLIRLQFTIKHIRLFGQEIAQEQLLLIQQEARLFYQAETENKLVSSAFDTSGSKLILKVLNLVALVGALFCLPPQIQSTLPYYKNILLSAVQESESKQKWPRLPSPEPGQSLISYSGKPREPHESDLENDESRD